MKYTDAGLNLEIYAETMAGILPLLARTWDRARVVTAPFPPRKGGKGSGGFASLFDFNPDGRYKNPVLVNCTDGVGSKLKIAQLMGKYDTVGIDLVAMSVNDLICTGGEPLVFLDYLGMHADDTALTLEVMKGISAGCVEAGCSLTGGETAILPDFYAAGDFDLAGFCTGVVERDAIIDGRSIQAGDVVLGLPSSGFHSNGYSLVRKVVFETAKLKVNDPIPELGTTVGAALLMPTTIYVKPIRTMLATQSGHVSGLANITGGGIPDNLGRILPPGLRGIIARNSWPRPAVFPWLQSLGDIDEAEMDRVFNQGLGFLIVCRPDVADAIAAQLGALPVGSIVAGETGVEIR